MTTAKIMVILEGDLSGAPEWIHMLPLGTLELADSRAPITVDQEALNSIIAAFGRRGNDLVIDYEHATLSGGEAPAAGWIKELEARTDGLWARVSWTDKAAAYIQNREYRYFSPVLPLDAERRPTEMLNAGLTNFPAITHLPPLVAKSREGLEVVTLTDITDQRAAQLERSQRYGIDIKSGGHTSLCPSMADIPEEHWGDPVNYLFPMPDPAHKAREILAQWRDPDNRNEYSDTEQDIIEARITSRAQALGMQINQQEEKAMPMTTMKGILGLTAEAQETEVLAAVKDFMQQATALKGIAATLGLPAGAKPEEITGAITALKGEQGKLQALTTEVAALKDREATRDAEAVVEVALKEGKLIPAERDLAVADAKRDPEGFRARLALRPQIVPIGDKLGVLKDGGHGSDGEPGPEAPADQRLAFKARALAAEKNVDLAAAQTQVLKDNPELTREYHRPFQAGA